jgi:hypothetical protein
VAAYIPQRGKMMVAFNMDDPDSLCATTDDLQAGDCSLAGAYLVSANSNLLGDAMACSSRRP